MAGPLSDQSFKGLRRVVRKFGYNPNREDTLSLIATVERLQDELVDTRQERDLAESDNSVLLELNAELRKRLGER